MTSPALPTGIRLLTKNDGQFSYQARLNCRRSKREYNQRFDSLAEAIQWRQQVQSLLDAGVDPSPLTRKHKRNVALKALAPTPAKPDDAMQGLTVRQAVNAYLKHREQSHHKLPANSVTDYQRVRDDWGDLPVAQLRNEDVANYIALMLSTPLKRDAHKPADEARMHSGATVRKFVYALKKALEWNAKNKGLELNKFLFDFEKGIVPSAWGAPRERRLHPGEEERLYAAGLARGEFTYSRQDWEHIIGFALETAMREQEIVKACWKHLSADRLTLFIPAAHTKTRRARTVLLSQRARAIVKAQEEKCPEKETRIFYQVPNPKALGTSFARLTERAGIDDLHFHDLRHEATSRLCEAGKLSQMAIMEMTGHMSMQTFRGYVHLIRDGLTTRLE